MRLILSVADRLLLPDLLPPQGRRIEMITVQSIMNLVNFTPEEVAMFELKDMPDGSVTGNPKKFTDKSLTLTAEQANILKSIPHKLDEGGKVTLELLPLIDKIDALSF